VSPKTPWKKGGSYSFFPCCAWSGFVLGFSCKRQKLQEAKNKKTSTGVEFFCLLLDWGLGYEGGARNPNVVLTFGRYSWLPTGLSSVYRVCNRGGRFARSSNRLSDKAPAKYEAKASKADEAFGVPERTAVLDVLKALPTARAFALAHKQIH
jgi:hypothetical protein